MSEHVADSPISIDRVDRTRGDGDSVTVRIAGRRLTAGSEAELDTLLVINLHGRRHRFAAGDSGRGDPAPGRWEASFAVPDWAVPVEYGQASIWVGSWLLAVPPVGTKRLATEPSPLPAPEPQPAAPAPAPAFEQEPYATAAAPPIPRPPVPGYPAIEAGRAGPLSGA